QLVICVPPGRVLAEGTRGTLSISENGHRLIRRSFTRSELPATSCVRDQGCQAFGVWSSPSEYLNLYQTMRPGRRYRVSLRLDSGSCEGCSAWLNWQAKMYHSMGPMLQLDPGDPRALQ
ncbi:MAG TPA: hypothetical protein VGN26_02350, partial [Armatimonadota bacterium]